MQECAGAAGLQDSKKFAGHCSVVSLQERRKSAHHEP